MHAVENYPLHWIIKKLYPFWRWPATFFKNNMPMQLPELNKGKKYCPIQHQSVIIIINRIQKTFFKFNIVSIVSFTSKKTDQNEDHAIKNLLQYSRRGPDQDAPFFYTPSHLSEIHSFKSIISTHFPLF